MLDEQRRADLLGEEVDVRWTRLAGSVEIEAPANVTNVTISGHCSIGAFTYTNHTCEMNSASIGRYCSIGQNTLINPGIHPIDFLTTHPLASSHDASVAGMVGFASFAASAMTQMDRPAPRPGGGRVTVQDDVWIGAGAIILQGVTLHTGAVVGAGAVVTHDVAPFTIVVGTPARVLRRRFPDDVCDRILASRWWTYDLSAMPRRNFSDIAMFLDDLARADPPLLQPRRVTLTS